MPINRFGSVRKLPSGRYQARFRVDGGIEHKAPMTFDAKRDAETWLSTVRADMARGLWTPDDRGTVITFREYADTWLADRTLKPRTSDHYRHLLDRLILPPLGTFKVKGLTPVVVRRWHADLDATRPTLRAHAYGLLRTILGTAVHDGLLAQNPCHVRGAGSSRRVHKIKPLTLPELEVLVTSMPEKYRTMTLLAAWCGLRFGELTELRRSDVDQTHGLVRVRRGVTRVDGKVVVGTPKTEAGIRDVAVPPHLIPVIKEHIRDHAEFGRDGLLFPAAGGGHIAPSTLYRVFYPAREAAGRPDLRWHDLRHTGAVLAASTGATLAELMGRLGHSTAAAALRYQHIAGDRDMQIARALSALAEGER